MRSGTLNVPAIVGFGEACALCAAEMAEESRRLLVLRDRLRQQLESGLEASRPLSSCCRRRSRRTSRRLLSSAISAAQSAQASPKPTMAGTLSVPERMPDSWPRIGHALRYAQRARHRWFRRSLRALCRRNGGGEQAPARPARPSPAATRKRSGGLQTAFELLPETVAQDEQAPALLRHFGGTKRAGFSETNDGGHVERTGAHARFVATNRACAPVRSTCPPSLVSEKPARFVPPKWRRRAGACSSCATVSGSNSKAVWRPPDRFRVAAGDGRAGRAGACSPPPFRRHKARRLLRNQRWRAR